MRPLVSTLLVALLFTLSTKAQSAHELLDTHDIVYARNLKDWLNKPVDSLMFDIYYPTGAMSNKKYPVYFSIHAGSFVAGSKQGVTEFSDEIADYGYIVISPDYRLGYDNNGGVAVCTGGDDSTGVQQAIYRAQQDINACVRYVTNHASELNVDTSKIFLGGASAGGILALYAGYVNDSLAAIHYPWAASYGSLQASGNKEPFNFTIKGICAMWGALPSWDSLINKKSAIPTILFKGGFDKNVPDSVGHYLNCESNTELRSGMGVYGVMQALGKPCVYHFQPNAPHTAYDNEFCQENTACFFNAIIGKAPYSGYYEYYDGSCR